MRKAVIFLICLWITSGSVSAGDLYKISIRSEAEATLVNETEIKPVYGLKDGYLIITEVDNASYLRFSQIEIELIAKDIAPNKIAFDHRLHRETPIKGKPLFEEDDLSLYRIDSQQMALAVSSSELALADFKHLKIEYRPSLSLSADLSMVGIDLDSLVGLVNPDTVVNWLEKLQSFDGRLTGTDSNYASADWIVSKFEQMGYDSVYLDYFTGINHYTGQEVASANVVAVKVGSVYPDKQIVVGGHFDAVNNSPGADDNGTGTVGTLEIARILSDIDTKMTFVFIAFDSEEPGLIGSRHYAEAAAQRGDEIVYMLNMDMIGHLSNSDSAKLYHGPEKSYSELWIQLADSLTGISGQLSGTSGRSDHSSFAQVGYDVTFVHEYNFSSVYHQSRDSTTYINFDYMKKLVGASLATVYVVNDLPPPVRISSVEDVGDGQSLRISWNPIDPEVITHYYLYQQPAGDPQPESLLVSSDSSSFVMSGLTEGIKYFYYLIAYDIDGGRSFSYDIADGTPQSNPTPPGYMSAYPLVASIKLSWGESNLPLDFSHYRLFRDGSFLADVSEDTIFVDTDPTLGSDVHAYKVASVDFDGNISDTSAFVPILMKAATLEAGRILAINRTSDLYNSLAKTTITSQFLHEALTGTNYDYFSDSSAYNTNRAGLFNLVDYGIVIATSEGGREDELSLANSNLLEDLSYYMSIGGKVILFGRWGNLHPSHRVDTIYYFTGSGGEAYSSDFNIAFRIIPYSLFQAGGHLTSDFVGAHSLINGYPDLIWDSLATEDHTEDPGVPFKVDGGIPSVSYSVVYGSDVEQIYGYDSRVDSNLTEGRPVGWRHIGGDREYVYFEFPLSFMERSSAVAALQKAVSDLGVALDVDELTAVSLPQKLTLSQNWPNPFNPTTMIEYYNPSLKPSHVTLEIFNVLGQKVRLLYDATSLPGWHQVEWDGNNDAGTKVAAGIYLYRLKTDQASVTKKMILLK